MKVTKRQSSEEELQWVFSKTWDHFCCSLKTEKKVPFLLSLQFQFMGLYIATLCFNPVVADWHTQRKGWRHKTGSGSGQVTLSKILFSLLVISERWVLYISYEGVIPEGFCNFLFLEYNLKSGLWIQGCIKSPVLLTSRFLRTFNAQAKCAQLGWHLESWVQQRWWMLKTEMCPISGCGFLCDTENWECNPKLIFRSVWLTLGRSLGFVQTTSLIPICCSFFWVAWRKFSSLPSSCQWMFRLQTASEHRFQPLCFSSPTSGELSFHLSIVSPHLRL